MLITNDAPNETADDEPHAAGPLAGVRVLELGSIIAAPFATRMLADFGAEVIKVEMPGSGDPLRTWGVNTYEDRSLWWPVQSRNKKLITLDLRRPEGQELCRKLAASSDVVVENFRPGTLERWGLGPDDLREHAPGLIVARISGYGQDGPYADRPGFASSGEAMSGLRYINGAPDEAPPRCGFSLGDSLAALFAVQGILMALYHRAIKGDGQVVDASIVESCFALTESIVPEYAKLGVVREPSGTVLPHVSPSNVYLSRDGRWVVIAANGENLWQRLCHAIDRPDLLADERFTDLAGRVKHMAELDAIIGGWSATLDADEIDARLNEASVVCAPVNSIAQVFEDPQMRARGMFVEVDDPELGPLTMPGIVPKLSATPGAVRHSGAWSLGADNAEVYGELLGLDGDALDELARDGIV
jgi:crotonobetainyl-CoA:carnitine CoA-transferase CaiB-like acyl-CoA transferase